MFLNSLVKRIVFGSLVPTVMIAILGGVTYYGVSVLLESNKALNATHQEIEKADIIQQVITDMESGQRGYLITGKKEYLKPFNEALDQKDLHISELKSQLKDNLSRRLLVEKIEKGVDSWLKIAALPQIALRDKMNQSRVDIFDIAEMLNEGSGKRKMDLIREELEEFRKIEEYLVVERNEDSEIAYDVSKESITDANDWIVHTHEVIGMASNIERLVVDMEAAQRGFLITGDLDFLAPYTSASGIIYDRLFELQEKVSDNPSQVKETIKIKSLIQEWVEEVAQPQIDTRRKVLSGGAEIDDVRGMVSSKMGFKLMNSIRRSLKEFKAVENRLMIKRSRISQDTFSNQMQSLSSTSDWLIHTHEVIAQSNRLLKTVLDMETGQRGFLITGNEEFLEPFVKGRSIFREYAMELRRKVNDDPRQVERIRKVHVLIDEWLTDSAEPEIEMRKEMNRNSVSIDDISEAIQSGIGQRIMKQIRADFDQFYQYEKDLIEEREAAANQTFENVVLLLVSGSLIAILLAIITSYYILRNITKAMGDAVAAAELIAEGDLNSEIDIGGSIEMDTLGLAMTNMRDKLKNLTTGLEVEKEKLTDEDWLNTRASGVIETLQGIPTIEGLGAVLMDQLTLAIDARVGAFYAADLNSIVGVNDEISGKDNPKTEFTLLSSYAYDYGRSDRNTVKMGEGLVGQCMREQKMITLTDVPDDYVAINSGLGSTVPKNIVVMPVNYEGALVAVLEFGSLESFTPLHMRLLDVVSNSLGLMMGAVYGRMRTEELLEQTQDQASNLASQQEELRVTNETLEKQAKDLRRSEEELKQQSEELRVSNEELNVKQKELEEQKDSLEFAKVDLEKQAKELAQASKYKSEFLANMSHELRTPLNSLLILAKGLSQNKKGNLTESQQEDAQVIYDGGQDLLGLINDILDLSKIEAGMLEIHLETVDLNIVAANLKRLFEPSAKDKGLEFSVTLAEGLPSEIRSDGQRIEQVLKNFLSNAMKFTAEGSVSVEIGRPASGVTLSKSGLNAQRAIAFSVKDTGIGIPEDKQRAIFEAFQQEDGSTSRKYGGTGLGLAISKEFSELLHGEIQVTSVKGEGASFTLYLPETISGEPVQSESVNQPAAAVEPQVAEAKNSSAPVVPEAPVDFIQDDRRSMQAGDSAILVVEDDPGFAKILYNIVKESGLKCLVTNSGRDGIYLAIEHRPKGILLDMGLPDIDGHQVLGQLKGNFETRHIPIHVISGNDFKDDSLSKGALGFLQKPASREDIESALFKISMIGEGGAKSLLVVEDDEADRVAIQRIVESKSMDVAFVGDAESAYEQLLAKKFDCIILDLQLPGMSGLDLLSKVNESDDLEMPVVIIHSAKDLNDDEHETLMAMGAHVIIKGKDSPERLLDEVSLFLHTLESGLSEKQKKALKAIHNSDEVLRDRKVLLVDDDMRNTFALSKQLMEAGLEVVMAHNGQIAIDKLEEDHGFEMVLMDIMMPVVDGYQAMEAIRKMSHYRDVPIIALTAKAMPEDKAKCINAGASEYLTKPIDLDKLFSMMKVWLYKGN